MQTNPPPYPLIKHKCREPYYTSPVLRIDKYGHSAIEPGYSTYISHMAECRCTYLVSLCLSLCLYLSLALSLHQRGPLYWPSHSLSLSFALSLYTKEGPCKLSPSQHSPTTPRQYELMRNWDIPRAEQHEQEQQQHDKVTTILMWTKRFHNLCTLIHVLLFLLLLLCHWPPGNQPYISGTQLHQISFTYRRMHQLRYLMRKVVLYN